MISEEYQTWLARHQRRTKRLALTAALWVTGVIFINALVFLGKVSSSLSNLEIALWAIPAGICAVGINLAALYMVGLAAYIVCIVCLCVYNFCRWVSGVELEELDWPWPD